MRSRQYPRVARMAHASPWHRRTTISRHTGCCVCPGCRARCRSDRGGGADRPGWLQVEATVRATDTNGMQANRYGGVTNMAVRRIIRRSINLVLISLVFFMATPTQQGGAHSGGTNAAGCHTNRKTGDFHCHRSKSMRSDRTYYCHVVRDTRRMRLRPIHLPVTIVAIRWPL